ncbi:MAG: carbohydrate ABC transporter permease [Anaerolineae bacterium]|jgi:multiple sugar transport system permease protein
MNVADWTIHTLRKRFGKISFFVALSLAAFVWLVPIIWMFSLSLTPNEILKTITTSLIPIRPTLANYISVFQVGLTPRWFLNSIVVTVTTTVGTLVLCSMAGYAFARLEFKGKGVLFPFVLAGLMVPKEAMFIPLFLVFAEFELHNTYAALILPRVAAPLGVFIMTQFFKAIPRDVEEAAELDGASRWTIFWRIMLPMSIPALTALAIFTFILTWNDYLWPLVSATEKEMFTITTGLASLQGNFAQATELGSLMARGVLASAPLLLLFLIFQRQLIRGIAVSSGGK